MSVTSGFLPPLPPGSGHRSLAEKAGPSCRDLALDWCEWRDPYPHRRVNWFPPQLPPRIIEILTARFGRTGSLDILSGRILFAAVWEASRRGVHVPSLGLSIEDFGLPDRWKTLVLNDPGAFGSGRPYALAEFRPMFTGDHASESEGEG